MTIWGEGMKLNELIDKIPMEVCACSDRLKSTDFNGGVCSDLLSYVMANAKEGNIWITIQTHQNIVAVAKLLGLAAIVVAGGVDPEPATLAKAETEGVVILRTPESAFDFIKDISSMKEECE